MREGWRRRAGKAALFVRCLALVAAVRLALLALPYRVIRRWTPRAADGPADPGKLRRTAWGVSRAAAFVPGATCLTQALAAQFILARSGCPSDIRVGVRRDEAGTFRAHAWLLSGATVVLGGDGEELRDFNVLTDLSARGS